MRKTSFTPWFSPRTPPSRVGVYEVGGYQYPAWSLWDGYQWRSTAGTCDRAAALREVSDDMRRRVDLKWRGLAVKP